MVISQTLSSRIHLRLLSSVVVATAGDIYISEAATAVVVARRSCMSCFLLLVWASCIVRGGFFRRMNLVDKRQ